MHINFLPALVFGMSLLSLSTAENWSYSSSSSQSSGSSQSCVNGVCHSTSSSGGQNCVNGVCHSYGNGQPSARVWSIERFNAGCSNGVCQYHFIVKGSAPDGTSPFQATCQADHVPRHNKQLRNCKVNSGNAQGVQAYMELRPIRRTWTTEFEVQVGFPDTRAKTVTYYAGSKTGNYSLWRGLSTAGGFQVVPKVSSAVAK